MRTWDMQMPPTAPSRTSHARDSRGLRGRDSRTGAGRRSEQGRGEVEREYPARTLVLGAQAPTHVIGEVLAHVQVQPKALA